MTHNWAPPVKPLKSNLAAFGFCLLCIVSISFTFAPVHGQNMNDLKETVNKLGETMIEESLTEQRREPLVVVTGIVNESTGKRDLLSEMVEILLVEVLARGEIYPVVDYSQIQSVREEWLEAFPDSSAEQISQDLADLLGADWSVTGSYLIHEGKIELQLQLYESEIDQMIWEGQTDSFFEFEEAESGIAETTVSESEESSELIPEATPVETAVVESGKTSELILENETIEAEAGSALEVELEDTTIETAVSESEESSELISEATPLETAVVESGKTSELILENETIEAEAGSAIELELEDTTIETAVAKSEESSELIPEATPVETAVVESGKTSELILENETIEAEAGSALELELEDTTIETAVSESEESSELISEATPLETAVVESGKTSEMILENETIEAEAGSALELELEDTTIETAVAESDESSEMISEATPLETAVVESGKTSELILENETIEAEAESALELELEDTTIETAVSESEESSELIPEATPLETAVVESGKTSELILENETIEAEAESALELELEDTTIETAVSESEESSELIPQATPLETAVVETEKTSASIPVYGIGSTLELEEAGSSDRTTEFSDAFAYIAIDAMRPPREEEEIIDEEVLKSESEQIDISQKKDMVLVSEGRFSMGSINGEANELPVHSVYLHRYLIDAHEVTNSEFARCDICEKGSGGFDTTEPDQPVVYVDWENADTYCRFVGKRLPTEAEWENSARAGSKTEYSFGNVRRLDAYAWYEDNAEQKGERYAHKVGTKQPNAWNIYDMHGNVMEWTSDLFVENYYQKLEGDKPWHIFDYFYNSEIDHPFKPNISPAVETPLRVVRGGAWGGLFGMGDAPQLRSAKRFPVKPWVQSFLIGFRCAADWNPPLNKKEERENATTENTTEFKEFDSRQERVDAQNAAGPNRNQNQNF